MILTVTLNPTLDRTLFVRRPASRSVSRATGHRMIAAGKGVNVARMVSHLGQPATALFPAGGPPGDMMELLLAQEGIRAAAVRTETWTRFQITFLDPDTWEWTTVLEPGVAITATERDALHARYEELLPEAALVVLSGSSPCRVLDDSFRWMTEAAHRRDRRVILDTYGESLRLALPAAPFMVKPNVVESEGLLGRALPDEASRWEAIQHYRDQGVRLVILTMGAEGALVSYEGRRWRAAPPAVETLNPVGSGDSLVGAVAVGLLRNLPIEDLIRLGIAAGAANAAVWEPASCTASQVQALVAGVRLEPVSP